MLINETENQNEAINAEIAEQNDTANKKATLKKWISTHKVVSIIITSLLSVAILFCAIGLPIILSNNSSSKLTEHEKMAIENVQKIKSMLKDPNSLILHSGIEYLTCKSSETNEPSYTYYFIDYGAKNSYGAMIRDTAVFKDNKYLGSESDGKNESVLWAFFDLSRYEAFGLNNSSIPGFTLRYTEHGFINKNKVMKNIE